MAKRLRREVRQAMPDGPAVKYMPDTYHMAPVRTLAGVITVSLPNPRALSGDCQRGVYKVVKTLLKSGDIE